MKFYYKAASQGGKKLEGFIEAKDIPEAARFIQKHKLIPINIVPANKVGMKRFTNFLRKSNTKELIFFTRQLASMLTSGLTLMQSLVILKNQMKNAAMNETVQSIVSDVENGKTLSSAIFTF